MGEQGKTSFHFNTSKAKTVTPFASRSILSKQASISNIVGEEEKVKSVLTLDLTVELIGQIYAAKIANDDYVTKLEMKKTGEQQKELPKIERFDAFVCRYFQQSHGSKAAARRHLSTFVRSVRRNSSEHARIEFFRRLAGIPNLNHEVEEFIPCLINRYFIPCLRNTFVNEYREVQSAAKIKEIFLEFGVTLECSYFNLMEAVTPLFRGVGPFADGILLNYGHTIKSQFTINLDKNRFKGTWLDFDRTMLHSLGIFEFAYKMSGFTKCRAVRTIQTWVRNGMPALKRTHKKKQWEVEEEDEDEEEDAEEVENRVGSEEAIPSGRSSRMSPREKLEEAQQLDKKLNGEKTLVEMISELKAQLGIEGNVLIKVIKDAEEMLGLDGSSGTLKERVKECMKVIG